MIPRRAAVFWACVDKRDIDGCWLWMGHKRYGYGSFWTGERAVRATHFAWFLHTGKYPENQINHHCDNPACVRWDHLYDGSQLDNMHDMINRGRKR